MKNKNHINLICQRVDHLRSKLLDLTRNPLISTQFSERTTSLVRIVDEVPELVLRSIKDKEMRIVPLPDLETDPKDENTREFKNALAVAQLNDEDYLSKLDEIDPNSDEAPNLLNQVDRQLKDKLREQLNMPPRQTKTSLSLQQHAKNHNISPYYELPIAEDKDGRHTDRDIQTLLLPDRLERCLNALSSKEKTWREETGISVLHAAFGFLKWQDQDQDRSVQKFSPLILIPIQIKKKRSKGGLEFWISSDEGEEQENKILTEGLRLKFDIKLSEYTGRQKLEKYFQEVAKQSPRGITWEVKRWAVIGVFPSTSLAMYHDLRPNGWDFASHTVVSGLLGGSDTEHDDAIPYSTPFSTEYDIDEPEIENKVSCLITDADSSQFSTIVDVADGKDLAVEGPPGTGKSQTIINTIATSLDSGKKVLFVAEKSAALEVVRSRVEAFGLGAFILSLQASRSGKKQVIDSIRDRIEMQPCANPSELDYAIKQFKETRSELKSYMDILSAKYGQTDFNIYTILGRSSKFTDLINSLPRNIKDFSIPNTMQMTSDKLQDILSWCKKIENAWAKTSSYPDYWKIIQLENIDPFQERNLLNNAKEISNLFAQADKKRKELKQFKLSPTITKDKVQYIQTIINNTLKSISSISDEEIYVIINLTSSETIENLRKYLNDAKSWRENRDDIMQHLKTHEVDESVSVSNLTKLNWLLSNYKLDSIKKKELDALLARYRNDLENAKQAKEFVNQALKVSESLTSLKVSTFIKILKVVAQVSKQGLAVRKEEMDDFSLQALFNKQVQKAQSLKERKALLSEEFTLLSSLPESTTIASYESALSNAGLFFFFSQSYKQAKQFYQSISKGTAFRTSYAARKLRELREWQDDLKTFNENELVKNILGLHFDSIDSDFAPFEEAISFFQQIDQILPGSSYTKMRTFLKYGDSTEIKSLPIIDEEYPIHKIEDVPLTDLTQLIDRSEENLNTCQADIEKIITFKTMFRKPEQISQNQIAELHVKIRPFLKDRDGLRNNHQIRNILGDSLFKGEMTDGDTLSSSLDLSSYFVDLDKDVREAFRHSIGNRLLKDLETLIAQIMKCDAQAIDSLKELATLTKTIPEEWLNNQSYEDFSKQMALASEDEEGLVSYSQFLAIKNHSSQNVYTPLVESILSDKRRSNICEIVEALIMRDMVSEVYKIYAKTLAPYDGSHLNSLIQNFQEADRKVIRLSRQRLQYKLFYNAHPPSGVSSGKKSEFTELALIKHEISKTQRYIPVRRLTTQAAEALLELKPCWMMSPLAVAQYLPKGGITFDLVIIDEASQMTPENALGALVRAKKTMIVGDTNQLPPTSFFRKVVEDDEADEDIKVTEESILEMANAHFKMRRLRWHYRSRDPRLISFSNKHIYNDDLIVFPSARDKDSDMGVSYVKVNGRYASGSNPEEAKLMVDKITEFMKTYKTKSLGVVVMNQKQRDLLTEEMNYTADQYQHVREYIEKWENDKEGLESFFIKNLENVQGDERDVIFIGTVYGPEKEGWPVMQRFGPIGGMAGKRRLNVLFSRAKERIVTFSSMTALDIRATEDSNPGVYMLKCWLEYSASGVLEGGKDSEKEPDSDFEEQVIRQIKSIGCEAIPQVGVKKYAIDIGVRHSDWPHGFIMGVECDGAKYHSSRSARDRDRLRQEVLEGLGWYIYRIWSTDWFRNPGRETEKLRTVIQERVSSLLTQSQTRLVSESIQQETSLEVEEL